MQKLSDLQQPTNFTFSRRNRKIYSMYKDELRTKTHIAKTYGLSRQRVQQLIKKMDDYDYDSKRKCVPAVFMKDMILAPKLHDFFESHGVSNKTIKEFVSDHGIYWMYLRGGLGRRSFQALIDAIRDNGYVKEAELLQKEIESIKSGT